MSDERLRGFHTPLHTMLLVVLACFGLLYVAVIPVFEAPDEPAHFAKAYGLAEGQAILVDHPRGLVSYIMDTFDARHGKLDLPSFRKVRSLLAQHDGRVPNIVFNASHYLAFSYALHAGAIRVVNLLGDGPSRLPWAVYACRLVSLMLFLLLVGVAFWLAPSMVWPFFWVAATPMALSQASVVSLDGLVLGTSMVILAGSAADTGLRTFGLIVLTACFLLVVTKPPYAPLILVPAAYLAVRELPGKALRFLLLGCTAVAAVLVLTAWGHALKGAGVYSKVIEAAREYVSPNIDPDAQIRFLCESPLAFLSIVAQSTLDKAPTIYHQFVGVLGWLNTPVPVWATGAWGAGAVAVVFLANGGGVPGAPSRAFLGAACLFSSVMVFLLVVTAVYVVWVPVASGEIHIQGRYLHPVAACLLMGLALQIPVSPPRKYKEWMGRALILLAVLLNATCLWVVFRKYGL